MRDGDDAGSLPPSRVSLQILFMVVNLGYFGQYDALHFIILVA